MIEHRVARSFVMGVSLCVIPSAPGSALALGSTAPLALQTLPHIDQEQLADQTPRQQRYWLGEDGAPLPFRNDDEIKEFLLTAEVVDIEPIGIGITDPERVTLEKGGVRAHAAFRYVDRLHGRGRVRGRLIVDLRDSFRFEPAAYELARLLGMDNVPPAVQRRIGHRDGTLQMWVYSSLMETDRVEQRLNPPNSLRWARQRHLMILFDGLIGNTDRNAGNVLIDGNWNVWLIDHTRAFYPRARYERLEGIAFVERTFWDRLRGLNREQLDEVLRGHISGVQIGRILERREHLVEIIEALIVERGEEAVLYDAAAG